MILIIALCCFLGLGALQPSCAAPRSNENNIVEVKNRLNMSELNSGWSYSITDVGFTSTELSDFFNYSSSYNSSTNALSYSNPQDVYWSYPSSLASSFFNTLYNYNFGEVDSAGWCSNALWYQFNGDLPLLFNYDISYGNTNPLGLIGFKDFPSSDYFLSYVSRICLRVLYAPSSIHGSVDGLNTYLDSGSACYYIRLWYMFDNSQNPSSISASNCFYQQSFVLQLPTPYNPNFVAREVISSSPSSTNIYRNFFADYGNIYSNLISGYSGNISSFYNLNSESIISPSSFSFYNPNSYDYGRLMNSDEGLYRTSVDMANLMFGIKSNYLQQKSYSYGYNAGILVDNGSGYQAGYNAGNQDGYNTGYSAGLSENQTGIYNNGYDAGYDSGYDVGYQQSIDDNRADFWNGGFDAGYASGLNATISPGSDGYQHIYNEGKQAGYSEGLSDAQSQSTTASQIFAGCVEVGLLPVNVFLKMFEYEVFGINIAGFVSALMTIAIVVIIIRLVTGKKNDK